MKKPNSTFKASNTTITDKTLPSQSTIRHTKRYGHKPARHKDHNDTKPIWKAIVLCNALCFKLKPKKTAKNNPSRIVIPKKTAKEFPKHRFQPTLESVFQTYMNLHAGSTRQAQRTPKNTRTTRPQRTNRNPAERFETALTIRLRPIQRTQAHERQVLRHSDSKRKWKEIPKVLPSANIGKRVSPWEN